MQSAPVIKDLVLLGGGHSHIAVLRSFGMRPIPGVRLTLISRDIETAYSGMLPGLIAGHYSSDQTHIDLTPLCKFAGARFFHDEVTGIDPEARLVELAGRPPASYDVLSVNTGSTPATQGVAGASEHAVPVKPINRFLGHWESLRRRLPGHGPGARVGVVGGGTGGVELCLAVHHALTRFKNMPPDLKLELLTADVDILKEHPPSVVRRFRRILAARGIEARAGTRVTRVGRRGVVDAAGREFPFHEILWVTQAGAPAWLAESGIRCDRDGFMLVNDRLQSLSHQNVFGAGDAANMVNHPRRKAGVFAVRQGSPLARNLRRRLLERPLRRFRPQRHFLKLVSTGGRHAVASRGRWSTSGNWVWRWKDRIDTRFMEKYRDLPEMKPAPGSATLPAPLRNLAPAEPAGGAMRCGGCGAKVSADALAAVLADIGTVRRDDVIAGLDAPDDAAMIAVPPGRLSVLSVDGFRPMIDDPWLFGRITANHCLGDIHAMGAQPQAAMTMATLPVWPKAKLVDELRQMLLGALHVFNREGVALVGGHTAEGAELTLGFSVTGVVEPDRALRKSALRAGDRLVLTKPLGTGTLLAADMRAKARGRWLCAAIECMLLSCRKAGEILAAHGAHACTDITGFGLAGHLLEMLGGVHPRHRSSDGRSSGATGTAPLAARIDLDALPALPGAVETASAGILSTLHPGNKRFAAHVEADAALRERGEFALLFDPQTAGGLLAGVPRDRVRACVADLAAQGYPDAAIIGEVVDAQGRGKPIRLKPS